MCYKRTFNKKTKVTLKTPINEAGFSLYTLRSLNKIGILFLEDLFFVSLHRLKSRRGCKGLGVSSLIEINDFLKYHNLDILMDAMTGIVRAFSFGEWDGDFHYSLYKNRHAISVWYTRYISMSLYNNFLIFKYKENRDYPKGNRPNIKVDCYMALNLNDYTIVENPLAIRGLDGRYTFSHLDELTITIDPLIIPKTDEQNTIVPRSNHHKFFIQLLDYKNPNFSNEKAIILKGKQHESLAK